MFASAYVETLRVTLRPDLRVGHPRGGLQGCAGDPGVALTGARDAPTIAVAQGGGHVLAPSPCWIDREAPVCTPSPRTAIPTP
jgi:hypothetical protein